MRAERPPPPLFSYQWQIKGLAGTPPVSVAMIGLSGLEVRGWMLEGRLSDSPSPATLSPGTFLSLERERDPLFLLVLPALATSPATPRLVRGHSPLATLQFFPPR